MLMRICWVLVAGLFLISPSRGDAEGSAVSAAQSLIEKCPPDLRKDLVYSYDSTDRLDWHYFPRERVGLAIGKLDKDQESDVWKLVRTVLSEKGIDKAHGVIRLEGILYDRENQSPGRDPGNYQVAIWGTPSEKDRWAWRIEGHHLSLNVTLDGDRIVSFTPAFLGANPATVDDGPWKGFRNLGTEEDLAREFILSLPKDQRQMAMVQGDLTDVESAGDPQVEPKIETGLSGALLGEEDRALLTELLQTYIDWFDPKVAAALGFDSHAWAREPGLRIQWKGGLGEGDVLHTYRITGDSFDIQYANNQGSANHVHTLVRTIGHDFGQ